MRVKIPSDYRLLSVDKLQDSHNPEKFRILLGPPGLFNAMQRKAADYISREEWRDPKVNVSKVGAERHRKDIEQYEPIELDVSSDTLLALVRDMRDAKLIYCGDVFL